MWRAPIRAGLRPALCVAAALVTLWLFGPIMSIAATTATELSIETRLTPQACGTTFTVVSTPNPGTETNDVLSVASIATGDVWATGYRINDGGAPTTTAMHYDGTGWTLATTPNGGDPKNGILFDVDGVATGDVWAAGSYTDSTSLQHTLVAHWDGSGWKKVKSPDAGRRKGGELGGIDARTATDVWAVGSYLNHQGINQPLAEHWNGVKWTVVPTPAPEPQGAPPNGGLSAVHALSATNVWAVGSYLDDAALPQPFTEHYNGSTWSIVSTPDLGADESVLNDVDAVSSTAVWAVGFADTTTLIERWNGSKWARVPSPNPGSRHNAGLSGISVVAAGDLWAAGSYVTDTPSLGTLVEHWNGTQWGVIPSNNAPGDNTLNAIDGNKTEIWAVGNSFADAGPQKNLALHRCPGF
jgi:hypothetical protein